MVARFDQLDEIDLGTRLLIKVGQEVGNVGLHDAVVFHNVRAKHFLNLC